MVQFACDSFDAYQRQELKPPKFGFVISISDKGIRIAKCNVVDVGIRKVIEFPRGPLQHEIWNITDVADIWCQALEVNPPAEFEYLDAGGKRIEAITLSFLKTRPLQKYVRFSSEYGFKGLTCTYMTKLVDELG